MKMEIEKNGDRRLVVLPPDLLAKLGWNVGDILSAEISENGVRFTRAQTAHDHAMEIAKDVMDEYRETFEALAKS
jgi:antitoxin component of MazEF toxin-antitoxin module